MIEWARLYGIERVVTPVQIHQILLEVHQISFQGRNENQAAVKEGLERESHEPVT